MRLKLLGQALVLPAYAGMIRHVGDPRQVAVGAPRVCGDDPPVLRGDFDVVKVLPAYAGMIREAIVSDSVDFGAPRVCGDDPRTLSSSEARRVCSPRMRG